jgi:hypothetical protein|tara:strand:+ start:2810 stop:3484 length:675 start_codon:yes stop_codon:yes gene_type:complete
MASIATNTFTPSERLGRTNLNEFFNAALSYKDNAVWKGDKRFFITFLPNINNTAVNFGNSTNRRDVVNYNIRTKLTGSFPDNATNKDQFKTTNLAELSTTEIISANNSQNQITLSRDFPLNQQYIARQHIGESFHNHRSTPPLFSSGSYLISKMNDNNPSLLVELNRDQQLPNGTGNKEFVVIPDNLHPFIKDNLEYFLIRAGMNVSGDASPFMKLDETNRNLL